MTDIPIIFSSPMIVALLDGRKSMTRRLGWKESGPKIIKGNPMTGFRRTSPWQRVKPGDRLWVRENLRKRSEHPHKGEWEWSATNYPIAIQHDDNQRVLAMIAWAHHQERESVPSIHMPRWASRLTLIVTATKIERLQEISEADAKAEGIHKSDDGRYWTSGTLNSSITSNSKSPRDAFMGLWCGLHGADAWNANPEVVALTFEVHKTNIDAMPKAEAA